VLPTVYSLTHLTGRHRNAQRRVLVAGFETKRATVVVSSGAIIASAPIAAIVGAFTGPYALFVPLVFIAAGLWLFEARQTRGLKLANYQAILDRRRARNGVLYAAGAPIPQGRLILHVPVVEPRRDQVTPLIIPPAARGARMSSSQVWAPAAERFAE